MQWGESVFGAAAAYSSAALSTRAQLGLAAVTGALLATDYEAFRNHAWSDVKGKARGPALRRSRSSCVSAEEARTLGPLARTPAHEELHSCQEVCSQS